LEIFKKPNFQVVKCKPTFIWKMLSQAELETEGSGLVFGFLPFLVPVRGWERRKKGKKQKLFVVL